jgi:hypothetical protein
VRLVNQPRLERRNTGRRDAPASVTPKIPVLADFAAEAGGPAGCRREGGRQAAHGCVGRKEGGFVDRVEWIALGGTHPSPLLPDQFPASEFSDSSPASCPSRTARPVEQPRTLLAPSPQLSEVFDCMLPEKALQVSLANAVDTRTAACTVVHQPRPAKGSHQQSTLLGKIQFRSCLSTEI